MPGRERELAPDRRKSDLTAVERWGTCGVECALHYLKARGRDVKHELGWRIELHLLAAGRV